MYINPLILFFLVPVDELLWVNDVDNENIDEYLKTIRSECQQIISFFCYYLFICFCIDPFADYEISLQNLLHCQMDTELAVVKFRELPVKTICKNFIFSFVFFFVISSNKILDAYREWSLDEIQQFEEGLREYGKNFFKIAKSKVIIK